MVKRFDKEVGMEYVVWGVPSGCSCEEPLFTKARTYKQARNVCKVLEAKYGAKCCRVQTIDLTSPPDFVGTMQSNPSDSLDEDFDGFDLETEMEAGVIIGVAGGRGGYSVSAEGKHLGKASEWDDAMKIATDWMKKHKYYPNLFYVNDHGNVDLIDNKGNIYKSLV